MNPTGAILDRHRSSWPGLSRPSTSFLFQPQMKQDVDARHKAGHDVGWSG
jgi:hypothetical protein